MGDYTLDVSDPQILLHFPLDPNGFTEHHRLLLCRLGPGRWVAASPDYELEVLDLNNRQHVILGRRSLFPAHLGASVYAFDPISRADLQRLKRQASTMAIVIGDRDPEDIQAQTWVYSDTSSPRLGTPVPLELLEDAVTLGSKGVVEW